MDMCASSEGHQAGGRACSERRRFGGSRAWLQGAEAVVTMLGFWVPRPLSPFSTAVFSWLTYAAVYLFLMLGFRVADGDVKQQTRPCGTLTVKHYKQEASLAATASLAAAGDTFMSFNASAPSCR